MTTTGNPSDTPPQQRQRSAPLSPLKAPRISLTSVLLSSIFFMADSVVRGYLMTRYLSILFSLGMDLRGYTGCRIFFSVLGR
jgi:hypothetical protein